MIRVLIVDDSAVVRRIVTKILESDPGIEVVGIARNGADALEQVGKLCPDLITLDIEMPVMDGLASLSEMRRRGFRNPVIMMSSLTASGADATLDALNRGASDFVPKPAGTSRVSDALDALGPELLRKIKSLCRPRSGGTVSAIATPPPRKAALTPEIVAIASSTGGPQALAQVISQLPGNFPVPIVIVQHMPAHFTQRLASGLNDKSALRVREADDGMALRPGEVWIAPGDHHLEVSRATLGPHAILHQGEPENSCRPAADPLFRSIAASYGPHALAIVLTGMGRDGCVGASAIRDAGGEIVVQDEQTSVVWGMPRFVAEAGLADAVLPIAEIAPMMIARLSAVAAPSHERG